jgi:hypothetical protein
MEMQGLEECPHIAQVCCHGPMEECPHIAQVCCIGQLGGVPAHSASMLLLGSWVIFTYSIYGLRTTISLLLCELEVECC